MLREGLSYNNKMQLCQNGKILSPIVRVKHIVKNFGSHEVLKDISFTVRQGEVICIIGSSGSGKSTLLRCVNLLETPTSGKVEFHGQTKYDSEIGGNHWKMKTYRAKVGMCFQSFNLFDNMTVLQNCMIGTTKVLKKSKQEAKELAIKYLKKVGMAPYINAKPQQLSGGQKQRVAIARALTMEPELLLFDEPTSALDPEMVGEVLNVMKELAQEGLSMCIVTHEMAFARDVSTRTIFMDGGVVAEDSTPDILFNNPQNPRTREFLTRFMSESTQ